ncbi:leucine-rich repeat protein SHOC-2-like isoform X1 [Acanthaster planci]|uniref:Leucine-rich repeat protein SHOC-2-like isoform X1 n=1 Tax=Acanthaster planci TaxID=133434 RepID=A0A8B7YGV3_ACAPL|nr:leucine-rich repeat protein SHOC-2-like isoform X1 [Acanthaster planci]XP_022092466.1 leucine-rich repeat protein SHOC-2-like isoform X1 [Acanthaster planci]
MATTKDEPRGQQNGRTMGQTLDLSSTNLTEFAISKKELNTCSTLILDYNALSVLSEDVGEVLQSLSALSLTGNQLKELPSSFGKLWNLKELSLSENILTSLPKSLEGLCSLTVLKLVGNKLKELSEDFGTLKSLRRLELDENELTTLPGSFGLLENLEILEAADNSLEALPANFGGLRHLEVLNLSNNRLATLPRSFGSLPSLRRVDLSSNKLEELMDYFDSCHCLEKLFLTGNRLSTLPDWIGKLPKLQEISLRDNQLAAKPLPEAFGESSREGLMYLDMSGNFVMELPSTLGLLTHLDFLHLGSVIGELERRNFQNGNWIERLPDNFGNLTLLRELRAEENQLSCLPENFGDLVSLEFLDLGQNLLRRLPDSFSKLKNLRVCLLSKNNIELLPDNFGHLDGLLDLRLDCNRLTKLPDSFTRLTNLETLDLFDNHLIELPEVLKYLHKLQRLDLDENDFDMPALAVPNYTKPNRYPSAGKSVTSKNWRTKIRPDELVGSHLATEAEESEGGDSTSKQSRHINWTSVLAQAVQKGQSMWQSHEGASTRESSGRSSPSDECSLQRSYGARCTFSYNDEDNLSNLNDDDEDLLANSPDDRQSDSTHAHPSQEVTEAPEENWDDELEHISCYGYDRVYKHPVNDLHEPMGLEPNFAFTPSDEHVMNLPCPCINFDTEEGQFEDADD